MAHQESVLLKMKQRQSVLSKKRAKEMRKIQRDAKQFLRKHANSKNLVQELALEREKRDKGSDEEALEQTTDTFRTGGAKRDEHNRFSKMIARQARERQALQNHRHASMVKPQVSAFELMPSTSKRNTVFQKTTSAQSFGSIGSTSFESLVGAGSSGSTTGRKSTNTQRAKRQRSTVQYLTSLQQTYEKEFRRKVQESNSQVETRRKGGYVEVIKPTEIHNDIPFLTTEAKVQSLQKYLDSNEPRIVVPKGFIRNAVNASLRESYQASPDFTDPAHSISSPMRGEDRTWKNRNGIISIKTQSPSNTRSPGSRKGKLMMSTLDKSVQQASEYQMHDDYAGTHTALGEVGADDLQASRKKSHFMTSVSQMVKKQVIGTDQFGLNGKQRKKTNRLFNVSKQPSAAFLKASDVLLNPFTLCERKTDLASEHKLRMPRNPSRYSSLISVGESSGSQAKTQSLTHFCKANNIPFNMNEKRFYQVARHEHLKNSWYHALAYFFHSIELRIRDAKNANSKARQLQQMQEQQMLEQQQALEQRRRRQTVAPPRHQDFFSQAQQATIDHKSSHKHSQSIAVVDLEQLEQTQTLSPRNEHYFQQAVKNKEYLAKHRSTVVPKLRKRHLLAASQKDREAMERSFSPKSRQSPKSNRRAGSNRNIVVVQESSLPKMSQSQLDQMKKEEADKSTENLIQKINSLTENPVDVAFLTKKRKRSQQPPSDQAKAKRPKKLSLTSMAMRYNYFDLTAYNKAHKMRLSEKLLDTLERNDVERPKVLRKKAEVFHKLSEKIEQVNEVKTAVYTELRKREIKEVKRFQAAQKSYRELLQLVKDRFEGKLQKQGQFEEVPDVATLELEQEEQKIIKEQKLVRVPCELERKFMDVLHLILQDAWEVPSGAQWVKILDYLDAFDYSSQMCGQDNALKDCFKFFLKAAKLFGFEAEFRQRLNLENQAFQKGSQSILATENSIMQRTGASMPSHLSTESEQANNYTRIPLEQIEDSVEDDEYTPSRQSEQQRVGSTKFAFTGGDTVTRMDEQVSAKGRVRNLRNAIESELEMAKQEHLEQRQLDDLRAKQRLQLTQTQLGGTRGHPFYIPSEFPDDKSPRFKYLASIQTKNGHPKTRTGDKTRCATESTCEGYAKTGTRSQNDQQSDYVSPFEPQKTQSQRVYDSVS